MRSRRKSNVKNIKDYIVPIITFGLIFVLIYVAFSESDGKNINSSSSSTEKSQNTNEISIKFDGKDSKAMVVDESDKKRALETGDSLSPGQTVMAEKGSVSFNIPGEAHFSLNKNGELKYGKDSRMMLGSSALGIESQNDLVMDMKFASVKIGKDSVLYLKNKGSKFEVDKSEGSIKNVEFLNNYLIYEWGSTGGMIKKVFDIKNKKEISKINFGVFTNDKKYIYSCVEGGYGPGYVQIFDIGKVFKRDIGKELNVGVNGITIQKCEYKNGGINFELFKLLNGKDYKNIGKYIYNLESNKLEKLD